MNKNFIPSNDHGFWERLHPDQRITGAVHNLFTKRQATGIVENLVTQAHEIEQAVEKSSRLHKLAVTVKSVAHAVMPDALESWLKKVANNITHSDRHI